MQRSLTYIMARAITFVIGGVMLQPTLASALPLPDLATQQELSVAEFLKLAGAPVKQVKVAQATLRASDKLPLWNTADTKLTPEMTVAELVKYRPAASAPAPKAENLVAKKSQDKFAPSSAIEIGGVQIRVYPATPAVVKSAPVIEKKADLTPAANLAQIPTQQTNAPAVVAAAPVKVEEKIFNIRLGKKSTKLSPDALHFTKQGEKIRVAIEQGKDAKKDIQIFVRDQSVVAWDQTTTTLEAKSLGTSELYVVVAGAMRIVPIFVGKTDAKGFELPDKLASIDGLMPQPNYESARFAGLDTNGSQPSADVAEEDDSENAEIVANAEREIAESLAAEDGEQTAEQSDTVAAADSTGAKAISVQESAAEAARTMAEAEEEKVKFNRETDSVGYTKVSLQVVDERSRPEQSVIYPVIGAQVHVVGTEFVAITDGTGHVTLSDMPRNSRFLVNIRHPDGDIRPTVAEVATPSSGTQGVIRLKTIRHDALDNFAAMARTAQRADTGSYCVSLQTAANGKVVPAAGYTVGLDVAAEGPVYFNQYGFLDTAARETGVDGRACFFNVDPGPVMLQINSGQAVVGTSVFAAYPSVHQEDSINVADVHDFEVGLGIIATAAEQLGADRNAADGWRAASSANITPIGEAQAMRFVRDGILIADDELSVGGRRWFTTQTGEFEPTVQAVEKEARRRNNAVILPLIPRGFIEDMSVFAQVNYDHSLGSVLVEHGFLQGQGSGPVSVRLLNESGAEVGEGWYFNDQPITKAIFFNVPPGRYSLLVETSDRYWLAAETLLVYSETLTVVQTGNRPLLLK